MTDITKEAVERFLNDDFVNECNELMNSIITSELEKSDDEADFDLIDECAGISVLLGRGEKYNALEKLGKSKALNAVINTHSRKNYGKIYKAVLVAAILAASSVTANAAVTNATGQGIIQNIVSNLSNEEQAEVIEAVTGFEEQTAEKEKPSDNAVTKPPAADDSAPAEATTAPPQRDFNTTANHEKIVFESRDKKDKTGRTKASNPVASSDISEASSREETAQSEPFAYDMNVVIVQSEFKYNYSIGEEFSKKGIYPIVKMSDGTQKSVDIDDCIIDGFDSSAEGVETLTIRYQKASYMLEINVVNATKETEEITSENNENE